MKTTPFRVASGEVAIEKVAVEIYRIPTDVPESDGTLKWDSTTIVLVRAAAGGLTGIGYTYADSATGQLIHDTLAKVVEGRDSTAIPACWDAMVRRTRNLGRPGVVSMAISAVDTALWDLKARLLDLPLLPSESFLSKIPASRSHRASDGWRPSEGSSRKTRSPCVKALRIHWFC